MLRKKTEPEVIRMRLAIAGRLVALRCELFGKRGSVKRMAELSGVPDRSWYSYERGSAIPALVILKIIVATSVEPEWLLHGTGPMCRVEEAPLSGAPFQPPTTMNEPVRMEFGHLGQERIPEPIPA
jgi:hypothetical protein